VNTLKRRIVDLIEALGPIPVSEYMALCLFDQRHGYYMTRDPLGRDGDFTTAPEVSQMFGELVGAWLIEMWRRAGRPEKPIFSEIGPGRGTLAKDLARTFDRLEPGLRDRSNFILIETSPKLAWAQATTIKGTGGTVEWAATVDELPRDRPLFIVGNELFDAVPARQFVKTASGWRERCVGLDDEDELQFIAAPGSINPALLPPDAEAAPEGAIFEVAPAREALMQKIAERIAKDGGSGLFIDYGHLAPGIGDTFQAMREHAFVDTLEAPGEADLTTHVDFAALAAVAHAAGLRTRLATQGEFLLALGLLERAGQLGANRDAAGQEKLRQDVERLAGPEQMGELFKVIAIGPAGVQFPGFPAPN
jgi:SAM-dependent MidA family methyltransferase